MRSIFKNTLPPAKAAKRSSTLGIGYLSSLDTGFTVCQKSPQILTLDLSLFRTGTIGATHSVNCTGSRVPFLMSRSSSSSILALKAYGMVRALQKRGFAFGSTKFLTLWPLSLPIPSRNSSSCLPTTDCNLS